MAKLPRSPLKYFRWIGKIMFLWVRARTATKDPLKELGIDPSKPVCYILANKSLSDILVLERICKDHKLPRPFYRPAALRHPGAASFMTMKKVGLFQVSRRSSRLPPSPLTDLVQQAEHDEALDVQLVPVSVMWGRNPGKRENSIFKLLFFDDEHAGVLQKFFIIIAQGRSCLVNIGKPISLREQVDQGPSADEVARKLRRVLRIHFRRQRVATLGPRLPTRSEVAVFLLQTKSVREAIADEARKKNTSVAKVEAKARKYIFEIAAESTYSVVRLFDIVLAYVWNKIFSGVVTRGDHRPRELSQDYEVVYLPSHRSHMDYLLLAYIIFNLGLYPPHIGAGVNLNFWPFGPLVRRAGAFFLRRSFKGDRLYKAIFQEYMQLLVSRGYSLKFYIEGGRSRTGRLRKPATGMLAMVVQSYMRQSDKPVVFLPIYIGYDKVLEVGSYLKELSGANKRKESFGQLLRLPSILRMDFGRAYIGFGEPIYLSEELGRQHPNWRNELGEECKPTWLNPFVTGLANRALTTVNASAVVGPVSIFALIILSSPQKAMAEEELIFMMDKLMAGMRSSPYSRDVSLPKQEARQVLEQALAIAKVGRFKHPGGDVLFLEERESVIMTYYRNNILHLVAVPALISSFLQHNDHVEEQALVDGCCDLYPFLQEEFFLRWPPAEAEKVIRGALQTLVDQNLLIREGSKINRPTFTSKEFACLKTLGRVLGKTLERYSISTALLGEYGRQGYVIREEFEGQCQLMAQRISILNGSNDPEFIDKALFRNYIDLLKHLGYVEEDAKGRLIIDERVDRIASKSMTLLSADIRQSIERITQTVPLEPSATQEKTQDKTSAREMAEGST